MQAFRLALALLRIPKLFASLLLIPLVLGTSLVYLQLLATGLAIKAVNRDPEHIRHTINQLHNGSLGKRILLGDRELGPIKVCRWITKKLESGSEIELPPSEECNPDRLDIARQTTDPANLDVVDLAGIFNGLAERLHVCKTCRPDIVIREAGSEKRAEIYSIWALWLVTQLNFNEDLKIKYVAAAEDFDRMRKIRGELYFHSKGFEAPLSVTDAELSVAVILNIAALIVISLWLALKAHRKVLDYFARSGALLPMVSATGKGPFYGAIWILTMLRVGAFLIATVPMMVYGLGELIDKNHFANLIGVNSWVFATWLLAITAGLALATLVASIADLRHRQSFFSFSYRYVPLFICASGALVWTATFIFDSRLSDLLRRIVTALPVAGMGPIMVAPIFRPGWDILIINAMLTGVTLIILLRVNARWFAAHLEEI